MKAILVIDEMPKMCKDCPLNLENSSIQCRKTWTRDSRPNWCPLKPMPEPKDVEVNGIEDIMHTEYSIEVITNKCIATTRLATDKLVSLGWNACLKEIQG